MTTRARAIKRESAQAATALRLLLRVSIRDSENECRVSHQRGPFWPSK